MEVCRRLDDTEVSSDVAQFEMFIIQLLARSTSLDVLCHRDVQTIATISCFNCATYFLAIHRSHSIPQR
jgi:hypothetical protein